MQGRNIPNGNLKILGQELQIAYDGFVALRCQSLLAEGRIIAVIGHNGAGKSTLIKALLKLLPPRAGNLTARWIDADTSEILLPEKHMAFCPESGSVFADISVESYVRMWCRLRHGDAEFFRKAGRYYLDILNIEPLLGKYGFELSKGQRRRVQTAIGFFSNPRLFLLDEPFDGLDVLKTNQLADIILEESRYMSFMLSSHRMDVVERLADTVIVLKEGEVFAAGLLEKVCRELCHQSARLYKLKDSVALLPRLKARFPALLINHIGNEIVVAGHDCDYSRLREFIHADDSPAAQVEIIKPGLVDAMNYHLRQIGGLL